MNPNVVTITIPEHILNYALLWATLIFTLWVFPALPRKIAARDWYCEKRERRRLLKKLVKESEKSLRKRVEKLCDEEGVRFNRKSLNGVADEDRETLKSLYQKIDKLRDRIKGLEEETRASREGYDSDHDNASYLSGYADGLDEASAGDGGEEEGDSYPAFARESDIPYYDFAAHMVGRSGGEIHEGSVEAFGLHPYSVARKEDREVSLWTPD